MHSGIKGPDRWLFLEPFVHLAASDDAVLFYNSLNGSRFAVNMTGKTGRIAGDLLNPDNGYVAGLSDSDMEDADVQHLVSQLRANFMGDLLDASWSSGKPANMFPRPYFKSQLSRDLISRPEARDAIDFNNYIHEVVIYLNSRASAETDPLFRAATQFVYPGNTTPVAAEISWTDLRPFLERLSRYKITSIQISGSDISRYTGLGELSEFLATSGMPTLYHLNGNAWDPALLSTLPLKGKSRLGIHFSFPVDLDLLNRIIVSLSESPWSKRTDFHFVVTSAEELGTARQVIGMANLDPAYLNPYYNRRNFDFFRDTVFITKEDIGSSNPGQNQVFSRLTVNETDFGRFTLLPDLGLYANLNDPVCGLITRLPLEQMILNELIDGVSWHRTRSTVSPCKECLFRFLCPPVSSYELVMQRFNFCDVYQPKAGT